MTSISGNSLHYMSKAIALAEQAYANDEVPVGAIIVERETNCIIAESPNRMREKKNAIYHAEILSIQQACKHLQNERLVGCDIYVSLEPCPMCAHAISIARLDNLFFAAEDHKSGGVLNGPQIYSSPACHHKPQVYSGIMGDKSSFLLKEFFKTKRQGSM